MVLVNPVVTGATQPNTAAATAQPASVAVPFVRATQHSRPPVESRRTDQDSKRRRASEEFEEGGSSAVTERMAAGNYRAAHLAYEEGVDEPIVEIETVDGSMMYMSPEEFLEDLRENGRKPHRGMLLDSMY